MAFSAAPSAWLDNWSEDGTTISIPIASLPELTAAEADASTGDIRKIVFALLEKLAAEWNSRDAADLPAKMTITKSSAINASTGRVTYTYSVRIYAGISAQEVEAES